jgi:hypothetical protein
MALFPLSNLLDGTKRLFTQTVKTSTLTGTLQSAATATGNGTSLGTDGYGVALLQITGTFVGTVVFEGSVDGTNFVALFGRNRNTDVSAASATAPGIFELDVRGLQTLRARISAYTSGSITVVGRAEPFSGTPALNDVQLTGSTLTDAQATHIANMGYNGATYDRWRNNTEGTLLASVARTTGASAANQTNHNAKGVQVVLNITAASGTGGLLLFIRGVDPISGTMYNINATPAAIIATGIYVFDLYPGASGTIANNITQRTAGLLPKIWFVRINPGDASSYTYSIAYSLIL